MFSAVATRKEQLFSRDVFVVLRLLNAIACLAFNAVEEPITTSCVALAAIIAMEVAFL